MGALIEADKRTARRKGVTAAAVGAGAVTITVLGLPYYLGLIGFVGAGYLAYDWFMYRAKRGMRF